MSAAHRSALDRLVALDTKEKKKADKRKLTKLLAAIASVRSVQSLVSEYLDMCSQVPEALE